MPTRENHAENRGHRKSPHPVGSVFSQFFQGWVDKLVPAPPSQVILPGTSIVVVVVIAIETPFQREALKLLFCSLHPRRCLLVLHRRNTPRQKQFLQPLGCLSSAHTTSIGTSESLGDASRTWFLDELGRKASCTRGEHRVATTLFRHSARVAAIFALGS